MDLTTLWQLTIGTLLMAAAMTLWERKAQAQRSRELGIWAAAYCVFAVGAILAMNRNLVPGVSGAALTNVIMVLGYTLLLQGVLALDRRSIHPAAVAGFLAMLGAAWHLAGTSWEGIFWNHIGSLPIAVICGLTALALSRSHATKGLRSRPIAVAVFVCHSAFYTVRAFVMPVVASLYGADLLSVAGELTMYEAVLFTVAMSMSFLALVREEERARLLSASRTDFLTGLCNRQGFFELGPERLRRAEKDASHALLAFDLDHFKTINDRYGHDTGDGVLRLFADIASEAAGPEALSARLGGEEFAILMPRTGADVAKGVAERIARRFAAEVARKDGFGIVATVSVGLAQSAPDDADLKGLLAAADRALYRAKELGRNRIEIARPALNLATRRIIFGVVGA